MATASEHVFMLWQLQTIDLKRQAIQLAAQKLASQPTYDNLKANTQKKLAHIKQGEVSLDTLQSKLRQAELDLATLAEEIRSVETRLYGGGISAKELSSMEKHLQNQKEKHNKTEETALEHMEKIEMLTNVLKHQQQEAKILRKQFQDAKNEVIAEKQQWQTKLKQVNDKRNRLMESIDPVWLERFQKMQRQRNTLDVIACINESLCGGCRVQLPFSLINAVQTATGPTYCENCGRILCIKS